VHEPQPEPVEAQREVTVCNPQGLHARPAMQFVDTAARFASDVRVRCRDAVVDGKSAMDMLTLGATAGSALTVMARGQDAAEAVEALAALVEKSFSEGDKT